MEFVAILAIAFAPGTFWLWRVYRRDRYKPEPRALVLRTFILGMAASVPIAFFEFLLYPQSIEAGQTSGLSLGRIAYISFVVAGLTEELGKYLVVRKTVFNSPHFDEPMDGIVYSAASALGFASIENVGYLMSFGWEVIILRGPFSTLAHLLFSAMWGYPLALVKMKWKRARLSLLVGLAGSMIAHGLFDFLLFARSSYSFLVLPLFGAMGVAVLVMLRHADRVSPFRDRID
ncbi:MAG: PrsW family intramembrane metalloprotease [Chloroflexi bacterium]|nr:PrsW family intramembrane metalloprotease [Chloroflexota bacterium]